MTRGESRGGVYAPSLCSRRLQFYDNFKKKSVTDSGPVGAEVHPELSLKTLRSKYTPFFLPSLCRETTCSNICRRTFAGMFVLFAEKISQRPGSTVTVQGSMG